MANENIDAMFDEEFGDLLSDVKPEEEKPVAEAAVAPEVEQTKSTGDAAVDKDTGGFVPFGATVPSVPIPRFKASKDTKARVALITKNVLTKKIHYVKEIGSFLCMDGKCCEIEGLPRVRYIVPVVQYTVNKNGAPASKDIELKCLVLGGEQYQALVDAVQFSGRDVTDVDIVVTCSDEQYQKLTFAADASRGAMWKTFPGAKDLANRYKENKDKLYMSVARKISMETYLTKKGFMTPQAPQGISLSAELEDVLDD